MLNIKQCSLEILLILLLFVDLFLQILPVVPLALVVVAIQFARLDLASNAFMSLIFLGYVMGALFLILGIPHGATVIMAIGFLLFIYGYLSGKIYFCGSGVTALLLIFGVMLISVLITSGGDYAWTKLIQTVITGLYTFIGFVILFANLDKIKPIIGLYPIILGLLLLRMSIITNQISGPASLFDFGFLRIQTTLLYGADADSATITYHIMGYFCLQGIALLLMKNSVNRTALALLLVLSMIISLYSGARQTMVITLLIVMIYFSLEINHKIFVVLMTGLSLALISLLISTEFFDSFFGDIISSGFLEGSNRDGFVEAGIKQFQNNPFIGVGYGRYCINGVYGSYPHNMIIEVLAELGAVGFMVMTMLLFKYIIKSKAFVRHYICYFVVLFMQAMVSRGLDSNIVVFSFIFATSTLVNLADTKRLCVQS